MGKKQYNQALLSGVGRTIATRFIHSVLADRASSQVGELGYCYPSYDWIAARIHCSLKTVERAIKDLQRCGHLIARSRWKNGNLTYDYLVVTGLSDDEIKVTLLERFRQSDDDADLIIKKVRARQTGKRLSSDKKLSFFCLKKTECPKSPDILSKSMDKMSSQTDNLSEQMDRMSGYPREDSGVDSLVDPKAEREDTPPLPPTEKKVNLNLQSDTQQQSTFKASKKTHMKKHTTEHAGVPQQDPTPPIAPPPPSPNRGDDIFMEIVKAICQKETLTRRERGVVRQMWSEGRTVDDMAAFGQWWARTGRGTPSPHQIKSWLQNQSEGRAAPDLDETELSEREAFQSQVMLICEKKRLSRRDRKTIKAMWDAGWRLQGILAFGAWWAVEYAWASKPPHVSQIYQHIADAVEWQQTGGRLIQGPANEYEYASASTPQVASAPQVASPTAAKPKTFRSRSFGCSEVTDSVDK